MIAGYFSRGGIPYVRARLYLPRLDIVGRVHFLVDTGATDTLLHPREGSNLGIPSAELSNPVERRGIGGTRTYYGESAVILLLDDDSWRRFDIELYISPPQAGSGALPSLLGRDILNTVRMDYDFPAGRLEFAVSV
ncbi:MAG: hypothetical protein F4X64_06915 [Chloroflexi bacterium]|nr:hypothetical protein [Chloroflexota bacterium]